MINTITKTYDLEIHSGYTMVKNNITYYVPLDTANTDYQEIQQWIADGGTVIDNGGGE